MSRSGLELGDYAAVIPAWNAAATIGEALRSIAGQTVPPTMTILVDDCSTDGTVEAAARSGVSFVTIPQQSQQGPGAATTAGLAAAKSDFVAFLDSDDLWTAQKMERQLSYLQNRPEVAGVFGYWQTFRTNTETSLGHPRAGWARSTFVVRRDLAEAVGPMVDLPGRVGDMIDWIKRAREQGLLFEMLPDVVALRRIRPGSLSDARANEERNRGFLTAARNALLRQGRIKTDQ